MCVPASIVGGSNTSGWRCQKTRILAEAAAGIHRQQILRWHKSQGLPRNTDGTYSLQVLVARLREFEVDKVSRGGGTFGQDPSRWDLGVDQVKDRLHRQLFETEAPARIAPLDAALQNPYNLL